MKLDWDYAVYKPPVERASGTTIAPTVRHALSYDEALRYIAGKDPRPLLVLRECMNCNGTDDALLGRDNGDNERTFLLSRWFHCVKLPVDVLQDDHPFHSLFAGDDPEHMFFCAVDGSSRVPFESQRSRSELWDMLTRVLKASYASDPELQVHHLEKTIEAFDRIDSRIGELERRVDALVESEGAASKKLAKVKGELDDAKHERAVLFADVDRTTAELKLRAASAAGAAAPKGS
jgi:hypothetical protein